MNSQTTPGANRRTLLGMSGGVDSSVAALLLQQQGYEVIGVTLKLLPDDPDECCGTEAAARAAKEVCARLGVPHYTLNRQAEFRRHVIRDFVGSYAACRTPNPCIECNRWLKFGSMYEAARRLDCAYLATGHYARIGFAPQFGRLALQKAKAAAKDQSYFLYVLPPQMLDRTLFPLGVFTDKAQIRELARRYRLPVAEKPESQDICFVPNGSYRDFLAREGLSAAAGDIVDREGRVLGKHNGLHGYTIGQRRGLGIAAPRPLYVTGFLPEANRLLVGEAEELCCRGLLLEDVNLLLYDEISAPLRAEVKIRHGSPPAPALLEPCRSPENPQTRLKITFDEPQRAIAPGQAAVFYHGELVIGGGKIARAL